MDGPQRVQVVREFNRVIFKASLHRLIRVTKSRLSLFLRIVALLAFLSELRFVLDFTWWNWHHEEVLGADIALN